MKINIDYLVYKKFTAYIKHADGEISGLAKVERTDNQTVRIVDIVLLHQVCTATNTDLQQDSIAQFANEMIEKGEDMGAWKCWWHSHANMQTFWSNTDTNTIESLDPETNKDNFFVSMVGNKKGDLLCRIDIFDPIRATIDKVDYDIVFDGEDVDEACGLEVLEKVTTPVTKTVQVYTPQQIAAAEDKKNQEAGDGFTPEDLGITKKCNYFVDSSGAYIMAKDGLFYKKTNPSKKDLKRIEAAYDREQREYEQMEKEYYKLHPEEKQLENDAIIYDEYGRVINYRRELYD